MMSPRSVDRLEAMVRLIGFGLAIEMVARSVFVILAAPGQDTVFQAIAGWSFPFTLLGSILVLAGHGWKYRDAIGRYVLATLGHFLGFVWAFSFTGSLIASTVTTGRLGSLILVPPFALLAAVHGLFTYNCARGIKWTRRSSAESSPPPA